MAEWHQDKTSFLRRLDEKSVVPIPVSETIYDVRKALGPVMSDLIARRLDPRTASSMVYAGNVMLKAIEVSTLEKRMCQAPAFGGPGIVLPPSGLSSATPPEVALRRGLHSRCYHQLTFPNREQHGETI